ncbi:MAG: pilus assembly protein PilM [Candidatus Omnitrophota bacterium]|nr:MAG: pilus assembly protein PilM [Candidatus Omnitrophota bacterium]
MKVSLGVEISEKYLKLVIVKFKGMQSRLFDCIVEPLKDYGDNKISNLIIDILKKDKYKPKFVAVSLPRNFATVRNLHLPSQNRDEISNMIDLHIDRIVPYKKEDVISNYSLAGKDDMGYSRLILAIVHNEIIKRQIRILDQAGFLLDDIALSSYGIWQTILNSCRSQISRTDLYLILDIDTTFTDFIIFSGDNMLFTRSIAIKSADIGTEMGARKFLGEIRQSLLIFQNEEINKKPVKIFLSGIDAPQIGQIIKDELDIEVKKVPAVVPPDILQARKRTVPPDVSLTSVSNLILEGKGRRLSFILPDIQIRKSIREKIRDLSICGTLAIYIFTLICIIFLTQIYNEEHYLKKLKERASKIDKEVGDLVHQLDNIGFVKSYVNKRQTPLYIISQLQKHTPQGISFNFVGIDRENKVTLRGQAYKLSEVFRFTTILDELQYFKEAQTNYTRQRRLKDSEITDFEISFIFGINNEKQKE